MTTLGTRERTEIIATVYVRGVPHAERHPLIFKTYEGLQTGQAFTQVVDHDQKPVLYELNIVPHVILKWTYLEQVAEMWQVQFETTRRGNPDD